MAQNTEPVFVLTPNIGQARLAVANAARDGSGTLSTLFTAGSNNSLVTRITFTSSSAVGAAAAKVFRIFIVDNLNTFQMLYKEIAVTTATSSNTAAGLSNELNIRDGLFLKAGWMLKVTQSVYGSALDQTDVVAEGGDY